MNSTLKIGIVGTGRWANNMFLPVLTSYPRAKVVAVCGRNPEHTQEVATKWNVPEVFTDYRELVNSGMVDAVIVATTNDAHYPITMAALDAGLHVLCDKPLALNYAQASEMADKAEAKQVKTMVPFTHRYMPTTRYLQQLIAEGFIGQPYHLDMRYYGGGALRQEYRWRNDKAVPGSGVLFDLGSHYFHLARWFIGEITGLSCRMEPMITHEGYESADHVTTLTVKFANGAVGTMLFSMVAWHGNSTGQMQLMELHGADGTLYHTIDWETVQEIRGAKRGAMGLQMLDVPESIWQGVRRDSVYNTQQDIFKTQDHMVREFVNAVMDDTPSYPDFREGARVQQLLDAAVQSARENCCWIDV